MVRVSGMGILRRTLADEQLEVRCAKSGTKSRCDGAHVGIQQYYRCGYICFGTIVVSMAVETRSGIPLSPAVLAILLSLAEGEKHGYAMMKDARSPRGGGIAMGPGTLYGSVDRMMRDGLVEESDKQDDERRRYYQLTRRGREVLAVELKRLDATVAAARSLGLLPHGGRS